MWTRSAKTWLTTQQQQPEESCVRKAKLLYIPVLYHKQVLVAAVQDGYDTQHHQCTRIHPNKVNAQEFAASTIAACNDQFC